jgi:hypothetical protein
MNDTDNTTPGTIIERQSKNHPGYITIRVIGCTCYARRGRLPHVTMREAKKCAAKVIARGGGHG